MDLIQRIEKVSGAIVEMQVDQPMIEVDLDQLQQVSRALKRHQGTDFALLLDICAVDYLTYGQADWKTSQASNQGYQRARASVDLSADIQQKARFSLVYHLLSMKYKQRLRMKVWTDAVSAVDSVTKVWPSALWYEREAYDLFGIPFQGHPDLRRILTDYGFVGYPLRKDFPLIGETEIRYDGATAQCVYEPVSIEHHTNVPRVIRKDHRYWENVSED
ncbi:NADH-quinone oxidoreductase subunit C [Gammaproteobacteria bacterium]|nr:NADH-quinone oxidoreductase subunit C [Gammaproteobacteria bacterium]